MSNEYIHGTSTKEQERLAKLNDITNEAFVEFLGNCDNLKVCDFGCGLGILVNEISSRFNNVEVTGLEISEEQIKVARQNTKGKSNINLINVDVMENTLPDNTFDITYCRYFLEHVDNPAKVVQEMVRVTKPGGKIICQENDLYNAILYPPIEGYDKLRKGFCELQMKMGGDPFIGRKLFELFKQTDVKEIKLSYAPEIFTEDDEIFKIWLENMLRILRTSEDAVINNELAQKHELEDLYRLLEDRIEKPEGVSLFHWNRVMAWK